MRGGENQHTQTQMLYGLSVLGRRSFITDTVTALTLASRLARL